MQFLEQLGQITLLQNTKGKGAQLGVPDQRDPSNHDYPDLQMPAIRPAKQLRYRIHVLRTRDGDPLLPVDTVPPAILALNLRKKNGTQGSNRIFYFAVVTCWRANTSVQNRADCGVFFLATGRGWH